MECRYLASLALGRLGAVDPGRIGLSLTCNTSADRHYTQFVFVDSGDQVLKVICKFKKSLQKMLLKCL